MRHYDFGLDASHVRYPLLRLRLNDIPKCDLAISYAFLSLGVNVSKYSISSGVSVSSMFLIEK